MKPALRARGALYGLAIGDALGMPTQMLPREEIRERWGGLLRGFEPAPPRHPIAAGMPAGAITDDTEQAVLLGRLLVRGHGMIDPRELAEALVSWEHAMAERGSLDLLGPSTKRAVAAVLTGTPPEEAGASGNTNGAAMRITPVGIAVAIDLTCPTSASSPASPAPSGRPATPATPGRPATAATPGRPASPAPSGRPATPATPGRPATPATPATPGRQATQVSLSTLVDYVVAASIVTHNTSIALAGAAAVAAAVSAGISGASIAKATTIAAAAARLATGRGHWVPGADVAARIEWAASLVAGLDQAAAADLIYTLVGTSLAPQESVPAAFAVLAAVPDDPWQACLLAASLGGDCDTIAAMAGAIAGACQGVTAFPPDAIAVIDAHGLGLAGLADDLYALRARSENPLDGS
jgi:ADP-ribosylglycohydrolase